MGWLSSIWTAAEEALPDLTKKVLGRGVESASDKVFGVPTPETPDMAQQGLDYRSYLDGAFPGTTPWERLGASTPAGAIESANINKKFQTEMQTRELNNARQIEALRARAAVISATAGSSPMAAQGAVDLLEKGVTGSWDSTTQQAREKLPSEISRNEAEASKTGGQGKRENVVGDMFSVAGNTWFDIIRGGARKAADGYVSYEKKMQDLKRAFYNNRKRPARFGV